MKTKYCWCLFKGEYDYILLENIDLNCSYGNSSNPYFRFRKPNSTCGNNIYYFNQMKDIIPIQKPKGKAFNNKLLKQAEDLEKQASELRSQAKKIKKRWF